ncbi:MAG TPA: alpha/beta hydrolase [Candidatus Limnocylindrales bacterium]|nr:alpha/beta hydrolase [Candidatus Limnocylindrales bacterium]
MHLSRITVFLLAFMSITAAARWQPEPTLHEVRVNGVALHYTDRGKGPVVILVHGGMEDYRAWDAQIAPLAKEFRVIAYSRRFNYPNHNGKPSADYSAIIDAEDLAALIQKLKLGPVQVVGHSYGAYVSLMLAARHPELVRSLALSEPPLLGWLNDLPGGKALLDDFMNNMWVPAGQAFRRHDTQTALRVSVDWFGAHEFPVSGEKATYDSVPPELRSYFMQNIGEWEALTTSPYAFPPFSRDQALKVQIPVLLLSGSRSVEAFKIIAAELARTLPDVNFFVLPDATHEMWSEFPKECTQKILPFLELHRMPPGAAVRK